MINNLKKLFIFIAGVAFLTFSGPAFSQETSNNKITIVNNTSLKKLYVGYCSNKQENSFCKKGVTRFEGSKLTNYSCDGLPPIDAIHTAYLNKPSLTYDQISNYVLYTTSKNTSEKLCVVTVYAKIDVEKSGYHKDVLLCLRLVPNGKTIRLYKVLLKRSERKRSYKYKCSVM